MIERNDHASEVLNDFGDANIDSYEDADRRVAIAQAHAILHLAPQQSGVAEQLRIANLIAPAAIGLDLDKDVPEAVKAMYAKNLLRPAIRGALGL